MLYQLSYFRRLIKDVSIGESIGVPTTRIELARLSTLAPETSASTIPPRGQLKSYGAENETRTRDPNLGKVVLYQLSYFRIFLLGA